VPVTRRPCTRPVNTSSPATTARTRPCIGRAHNPSTPPVYMTVYGPSARISSAVYMARTRPRTRDVYTAVYGPCIRPCTRHVYGRAHVSTCTRAVYTAVLHGRVRAIYTSENGRLHGRTRPCNVSCIRPCSAVSARVHDSERAVRAVSDRVDGRVRAVYRNAGRVHGSCAVCYYDFLCKRHLLCRNLQLQIQYIQQEPGQLALLAPRCGEQQYYVQCS